MKLHANARTCPHSRLLAVKRVLELGWTLAAAAEAAGVSVRTVSKWRRRYRAEGDQGLFDRFSAPSQVPSRTCERPVVGRHLRDQDRDQDSPAQRTWMTS